jgi:hypothetical protein
MPFRVTERKRPFMPHFKCVVCKTRLYSAAARADLVADLCPGCGSPLEPVGELTEIVGFQSVELRTSESEAMAQAIALPAPKENP